MSDLASLPTGPCYVINADGTFGHRLLFGLPDSAPYAALVKWAQDTPGLHRFVQDFHRLQVEWWIWLQCQDAQPARVLDIGVYQRRTWLGPGYRTLGLDTDGDNDYVADLLDGVPEPGLWDAIICSEVLEHVEAPWAALDACRHGLKPGGRLIASSPFIWPDHHQDAYPDYWRFTEQGWRLLLRDWVDVVVQPCGWSRMGRAAWTLLADAEVMNQDCAATTGYLVTARKP